MRIRLFGSLNCKNCLQVLGFIKKYNITFQYIDALDDKTQDICDFYDVEELPHIHFISDNKNNIIEHIGEITEKRFVKNIRKVDGN